LAYPSKNYSQELAANETKRVQEQIKRLGPEKLKEFGETVRKAVKSAKLPPSDVLASIPTIDVEKIDFRSFTFYNYTTEIQPEGFDLRSIPFRFQFDDVHSQFIRFYVFLDTKHLSEELKPYLTLVVSSWLQCPIKKDDGTIIPLADVLRIRAENTVTFQNKLGYKGKTFFPGGQSDLIMFYMEADLNSYETVNSSNG